jgi:uroporphyrinogen-III synthase
MAHAVVTRDSVAAQPYAAALAPLGLEVVAMPVTRVAAPADPAALAAALAGDHDAIVCASARAADALVASGPTRRHTWPHVWAVGPATARRLAEAGIAATVPPGARDGATLAAAMISEGVAGLRILAPRAEEGREEAIAMLRAAGAIVDDVVAYRMVPVPPDDAALTAGRELLTSGRAAVCAAFAPSQVRALDAIVAVRALPTAFVAIGETTAAAFAAAGAASVAVAATPTPEGIANAVASVYPIRR